VGIRLAPHRTVALLAVAVVVVASLLTGWAWPVAVDHGGDSAGNPISRYGPHWLYPTVASIMLIALLVLLLRPAERSSIVLGLTAFAAGAASNLAQWVLLGGVSNPVPAIHGSGHLSIGDICLWIGALALASSLLPRRRPTGISVPD
jgi:hypothetical protein